MSMHTLTSADRGWMVKEPGGMAEFCELDPAELEAIEGGILPALLGGFAIGFAAGLVVAYVTR
jgi:lactobin A/cerein 7B family class IIb bacteriocin